MFKCIVLIFIITAIFYITLQIKFFFLQINLLKEGGKNDNMKTFQDGDAQHSDTSSGDLSDNSTSVQDHSSLKQKVIN